MCVCDDEVYVIKTGFKAQPLPSIRAQRGGEGYRMRGETGSSVLEMVN